MPNKNNSPEQKRAWKANQNLGSRFTRVIRADKYAEYLQSDYSKRHYDSKGRMIA